MTQEPVYISCKTCRGYGEREHVFYVKYPEEYTGGDGHVELVECLVCKGTGKVVLDED